jgi:hypothetical protein
MKEHLARCAEQLRYAVRYLANSSCPPREKLTGMYNDAGHVFRHIHIQPLCALPPKKSLPSDDFSTRFVSIRFALLPTLRRVGFSFALRRATRPQLDNPALLHSIYIGPASEAGRFSANGFIESAPEHRANA